MSHFRGIFLAHFRSRIFRDAATAMFAKFIPLPFTNADEVEIEVNGAAGDLSPSWRAIMQCAIKGVLPTAVEAVKARQSALGSRQLLMRRRMRALPSDSHCYKVVFIYLWRVNVLTSSHSLPLNRSRQIRCSHSICINSSARNFSIVIYVFGAFETSRIAAFEIVEVCGCVAVIPNNGSTINKVRVA